MTLEYQSGTATYHVACDHFGCESKCDTECRYWDIAVDVLREYGWKVDKDDRVSGGWYLVCGGHGEPEDVET